MSAHSYSTHARARIQIGAALGLFLAPLQPANAESVTLLARLRADLPGTNAALDSGVALQRRFATEPLLSTTLLRPTSLRSATGLEKLPESPWLNKSPNTPDAQLRRWISVEYPSTGPSQTTALIAGLKATGLFDLVEKPVGFDLAAVESEPLYSYVPSDPQDTNGLQTELASILH